MLAIVAVVLLVAWLLGISVFHVAGSAIHILIILAVISLVMHLSGAEARFKFGSPLGRRSSIVFCRLARGAFAC